MAKAVKQIPHGFVRIEEAAELMACSIANINKLLQEEKLTRGAKGAGHVCVRSICALLRERKAEREEGGETVSQSLKREQARYRRLKADLADIELKLANGDAVESERVVAEINRAMLSLRDSMLDAARRLPEQCQGQDARVMSAVIEGELRRILEDLHRLITSPLPDKWKAQVSTDAPAVEPEPALEIEG